MPTRAIAAKPVSESKEPPVAGRAVVNTLPEPSLDAVTAEGDADVSVEEGVPPAPVEPELPAASSIITPWPAAALGPISVGEPY